jgi:uncharacterized protein
MANPNTINWYELGTTDLERAARFYEAMLGIRLKRESFMGTPHAIFQRPGEGGVGGALIQAERLKPGAKGTLVYLDALGDLPGALQRAQKAGGKVILPATSIGPMGQIAVIEDTEGNQVGLHSRE